MIDFLIKQLLRIRWKLITIHRRIFRSSVTTKSIDTSDKQTLLISEEKAGVFFGYHDKTPFSSDNSKILACRVEAPNNDPKSEGTKMEVGYYAIINNQIMPFTLIGETYTWCWQQACMLQWMPQNENQVIFNKMIDNNYGSAIVDVASQQLVKEYTFPIYTVSSDGMLATTLNFSRLGRLRPGYGYNNLPDLTSNLNAPVNDGLFIVNLQTGEKELIISFSDLASVVDKKSKYQHYVNHAVFSPDGNQLVFFHIWQQDNENKRKMRFCSYNLRTKAIDLIESERTISHLCWKSNHEVLATTIKTYFDWEYRLYDIITGTSIRVMKSALGDGHPMTHPNKNNTFITDTYPDNTGYAHLIEANYSRNMQMLKSFYIPDLFNGQARCDLHPRWNNDGAAICCDIIVCNKRSMCIVKR